MKLCEVWSKIYVAINAWHCEGLVVTDSHSSAGRQHLHTDGEVAADVLAEGCRVQTHTHVHTHTVNTDQENVVHQ